MGWSRAAAIVLALGLIVSACGPTILSVPRVGFSIPQGTERESYVRAMIEHLHYRGYTLVVAQPHRGRIGVRSQYTDRFDGYDEYGTYRFAITCGPHTCEIEPIGPRVEPIRGGYRMPEDLRTELLSLRSLANVRR